MHALLNNLDNDILFVDSFPENNQIDFETPIMSLPFLFNTTLDTIPAKIPYIYANDNDIMSWANCFKKRTFKVGICWQGSKNKIDYGRSFPLSLFEDISKLSIINGLSEPPVEEVYKDSVGLSS